MSSGPSGSARSSESAADEALKLKVIDLVATDLDDLLRQVNGRSIRMDGRTITLDTTNASIERVEPDWRSRLLAVIGDPASPTS